MYTSILIFIYCVGVLITTVYLAILQSMSAVLSLSNTNEFSIYVTSIIAGLLWPVLVVSRTLVAIYDKCRSKFR